MASRILRDLRLFIALASLTIGFNAFSQTPQSIAIVGPDEIPENRAAVYKAVVTYSNLTAKVVTPVWNNLSTGENSVSKTFKVVGPPTNGGSTQVQISISYTESNVNVQDSKTISVTDFPVSGDAGLENARLYNHPRPESIAGYNVDTATGTQMLEYELLPFQGGLPFSLVLSYNSAFKDEAGIFGPGWYHNYEIGIQGDENDVVEIVWGIGFRSRFQFIEEVDGEKIYAPIDDSNRRDTLIRRASKSWLLTLGDGTEYDLSSAPLPTKAFEIRNKVGDRVQLAGSRFRLVDASNEINLHFDDEERVDYLYDETDDNNGNAERYVDIDYDENGRLSQISQAFHFMGTRYSLPGSTLEFPDNNPTGATFTFTVDDRTDPIGMLRFSRGEILYQRPEDIIIKIISPSGTEVTMINNQDLSEYTDGGRVDLPEATGFTNAFEGENPAGEWKVVAIDNAPTPEFNPPRLSQVNFQFSDPTNPKEFFYDSNGRVSEVRDPVGHIMTTFYDSEGRVIQQDDGVDTNEQARFSYTENEQGVVTTFTDREGNDSVFLHDGRYCLQQWTDPLGNIVTFEFDQFGNKTAYIDQLGRRTSMQYDVDHNLISGIDPSGRSVVFDYDENRNVEFVLDARGNQSAFGYDENQNLDTVTDAIGKITRKEFNNNSDLRKLILPDGAIVEYNVTGGRQGWNSHASDPNRKEFRTYDEVGRLTRIKDRQGWDTEFEYSPTSKKLFEEDPFIKITRFEYDKRDRLTKEIDKNGNETTYEYDGNDNLIRQTDALGDSTDFEYDGEDRLVKITNPLGNTSQLEYDAFGRTIAETDALGNTTRFEYDAVGNQTATYDAKGNLVQSMTYTVLDQEATMTDAHGNTVTKQYDDNGNLISVTDPLGRRTRIAYDSLDRTTSITDPMNRVARKIYNDDSTIARIENPGGSETEYVYDNANRITEVVYGDRILTYSYDDWRDLITTAFDGSSDFDFEYDRLGRRTSSSSDNISPNIGDITYEYDAQGNLTRVSGDGAGNLEIVREYDALNRVTSYTDIRGDTLTYTYDSNGRRTSIGYPDGKTVAYAYDALDRVIRVTDWVDRKTEYTYDVNDQVTRVDFPNGSYRTMEYNKAQRLIKRGDYQATGAVIVEYKYDHNQIGEVVSVIRTDGFEEPYAPQVASFTYDSNNVPTSYNGINLETDDKGNLTKLPYYDGVMDVDYYGNNSIRWNSYENGRAYDYDLEDRLYNIGSNDITRTFVVNPHAGLSQYLQKIERNGDTTNYVYGLGLIYEENENGDIVVYHYDDRGSTVAQSDGLGNVVKRYSYGPYGERVDPPSADDSPFLFLGMFGVLTDENGLCYMRFRHYSPTMRRFVGPDAFPGNEFNINSLNKFAYAHGNPIGLNDPEGEFVNILIGAAAGAIGGVVAQGVSDLITGQKPDWKNYVSAAAGGAVTGALIGSGAGAVFAGAAGGFTQEFLNQGLNGGFSGEKKFDAGQLALQTAIGGAAGAIGTKFKSATGITSKAGFRKQVIYKGLLYSSKAAVRQGVVRQVAVTVGIGVGGAVAGKLVGLGAKATGEFALTKAEELLSSYFVDVSTQSKSRFHQIRQYVQGTQNERSSAFNHFETYQGYMRLAGIPLPNSPNSDVTGF